MSPLRRRFGWAQTLAGFAICAALAALPVLVKGATSEESTPTLAVSSRGSGSGSGGGGGSSGGGSGSGVATSAQGATAARESGAGTGSGGARAGGSAGAAGGGAGSGTEGEAPGETPAAGGDRSPSPGRKPGRSPAKTPASGGGGGSVTGTITGDTIDTQYGPMQFAIQVRDGRVLSVQDLKLPGDTRSLEINNPAMPKLHAQTVRTQAAHVDTISGATITCQAYTISIQSALDRM